MKKIWLLICRMRFVLKDAKVVKSNEKYVSFSIPCEVEADLLSKAISLQSNKEFATIIFNNLEDIYTTPFLLYSLGYTYEEIASILLLPTSVVKGRLFYTQKKMQMLLTDVGQGIEN